MYSYTSAAVSCLAVLASLALAAPNVSKNVIIEKQVPANNEILGSLGASASWGPYSAGAGLGGNGGGGGLFAGANSPHGTAGAGLGGGSSSSASASASAGASGGAATGAGATASGGKPQQGGPTFFDRIFNIPISILQSVNTNLNTNGRIIPHHERYIPVQGPYDDQQVHEYVRIGKRGNIRKRVYVKGQVGGNAGANAGGSAQAAPAAGTSSASASASASSDAGAAGAPATAQGHATANAGVQKNYDAVFNIPITALRSVNEFLNGK